MIPLAQPADRTSAPVRRLGAILGSLLFWLLVGWLVGWGVAGILSIGIFLLIAALVLFVIGVVVPAIGKRTVPALLIGAAVAPLTVAWRNQDGPGELCTSHGCSEYLDPWPWFVVGVTLALAGTALTWLTLRRTSR